MAKYKLKLDKILLINLILIPISLILLILTLYALFSLEDVFGEPVNPVIKLFIIILSITVIIIVSLSIVISVKEYKNRFTRKQIFFSGRSRLTLKEIFENENRKRIIKFILESPGIHHNELLRESNIQKGQLQWHLDVLLKYNIIKKEKFGQYSVYFPIINSIETLELFENGLAKSETTSKIFELIKENPGIYSSEIAHKVNLARNTVKYHIDKLIKQKLIEQEKKGRKIALYSSI
ncbi:MAG: winged helix-turn-helix transcriptional regulator [Candidatus Hermodarchaeota archaeon]